MTGDRDDGFPVRPPGELFERLGLDDLDGGVMRQALVHSSFAHEQAGRGEPVDHNGRLEFLGDAVVDMVVSQHLFLADPAVPEGEMTRLRSGLVSAPSLAARARDIGLGCFLYLARGEAQGGGRDRESVLAEALEALVAAVFIAGGWDRACLLVGMLLELEGASATMPVDPKSRLQERTQALGLGLPSYSVVGRSGPDHSPRFEVEVSVDGKPLGLGAGTSKKAAENEAARAALDAWREPR